jgi:GTP cyclohydrolase IA
MPIKSDLIIGSVMQILSAIGEDPEREGLVSTPTRYADMLHETMSGYDKDPRALFRTFEEGDYDQLVAVGDIPFYSTCEHHMLPFFGTADVGYVPRGRVIGLSKLPRLVHIFASRLQMQERMTVQIADMLMSELEPMGCIVVIRARHLCMEMRGIRVPGTTTTTSALRGMFQYNPGLKSEFLELIGHRQ